MNEFTLCSRLIAYFRADLMTQAQKRNKRIQFSIMLVSVFRGYCFLLFVSVYFLAYALKATISTVRMCERMA